MYLLRRFACLAGLSLLSSVYADTQSVTIYKFLDEQGVLHLTNKCPPQQNEVLYARSYVVQSYQPPPLATFIKKRIPVKKPNQYVALIAKTAIQTELPVALLHAVIKMESNYNPKALSPKGAKGLMQLMPATAKRYGVIDRADPHANVRAGAQYLRDLLDEFGSLPLALAAYNAGENAVKRYGNKIPPYRETQNYVRKVQALYQRYVLMM